MNDVILLQKNQAFEDLLCDPVSIKLGSVTIQQGRRLKQKNGNNSSLTTYHRPPKDISHKFILPNAVQRKALEVCLFHVVVHRQVEKIENDAEVLPEVEVVAHMDLHARSYSVKQLVTSSLNLLNNALPTHVACNTRGSTSSPSN